jgi:pimeloyl-ACP methyl ester carboxylesterase
MPYVNNPVDEGRVYYESSGSGHPLVIHQGFMRTTDDAHYFGYVEAFRNEYQVILLDSRAHGKTDGPHDPAAYTGELLAGDVIAVLDALGIYKTHFIGYSSGGRTGYAILEHHPERLLTLVIGGKDVFPLAHNYLESTIKSLEAGIEEFVSERERLAQRKYPDRLRSIFMNLDAEALKNLCITYMSEGVKGLETALPNASMPILLYVGGEDSDLDKIKKTSELIPESEFRVLPGLNHGEGWENTDLAFPVIFDFLSRHKDGS